MHKRKKKSTNHNPINYTTYLLWAAGVSVALAIAVYLYF
jgi:hypothetical protein